MEDKNKVPPQLNGSFFQLHLFCLFSPKLEELRLRQLLNYFINFNLSQLSTLKNNNQKQVAALFLSPPSGPPLRTSGVTAGDLSCLL